MIDQFSNSSVCDQPLADFANFTNFYLTFGFRDAKNFRESVQKNKNCQFAFRTENKLVLFIFHRKKKLITKAQLKVSKVNLNAATQHATC